MLTSAGPDAHAAMARATGEVQTELARVDAKASTLFTVAGTGAGIGVAVLARADLPILGVLAGWATVAVAGTAVGLLALAVRPAIKGDHGWVDYAGRAPGDLMSDFVNASPLSRLAVDAHRLVWLSQAARRKYARVRAAVDLLLCALAGIAMTAVLTALP